MNIPLPPEQKQHQSHSALVEELMGGGRSQGRLLSLFMESILKCLTVSRPACDDRHRGQEGTQDSLWQPSQTRTPTLIAWAPLFCTSSDWTKRAFLLADHTSWHATSCKTSDGASYQKRCKTSPGEGRCENATLFFLLLPWQNAPRKVIFTCQIRRSQRNPVQHSPWCSLVLTVRMELSRLLVRVAYCMLIFLRALYLLVMPGWETRKGGGKSKNKHKKKRGYLEPTFKLKPGKWKAVTPFF